VIDSNSLTRRQIEVLQYTADGITNREIGVELDISFQTVKIHKRNIYKRLNATCAAHAVAIGFRKRIIK